MTQATEILPRSASQTKLIGGVCLAHMVSYYNMVLLAPLFVFIRADYGVTYTELGLALTAFAVVSTFLQTPVGFLVDRVDARLCLIGGLLLGSCAIAAAALIDWYWAFIAAYAVLGVANTVYHPADYALLSENVAPERLTQRPHQRKSDAAAPATTTAEGWRLLLSAPILLNLAFFLLMSMASGGL